MVELGTFLELGIYFNSFHPPNPAPSGSISQVPKRFQAPPYTVPPFNSFHPPNPAPSGSISQVPKGSKLHHTLSHHLIHFTLQTQLLVEVYPKLAQVQKGFVGQFGIGWHIPVPNILLKQMFLPLLVGFKMNLEKRNLLLLRICGIKVEK